MQNLEEVIRIKEQLEEKLRSHPGLSGIEVGPADREGMTKDLAIRVYVSDPGIGHKELGIPENYQGVPVQVQYRKIELH